MSNDYDDKGNLGGTRPTSATRVDPDHEDHMPGIGLTLDDLASSLNRPVWFSSGLTNIPRVSPISIGFGASPRVGNPAMPKRCCPRGGNSRMSRPLPGGKAWPDSRRGSFGPMGCGFLHHNDYVQSETDGCVSDFWEALKGGCRHLVDTFPGVRHWLRVICRFWPIG
jgi:hypothetical protein